MRDDEYLPALEDDDADEDAEPDPQAERDAEVSNGLAAFLALVDVAPADRSLAVASAACVLHAAADARGPDDPTPGMLTVPVLIEDAVARAQLADAAPGARDALGELEVALVGMGPPQRTAVAERLRAAIRDADNRLRP